MRVEKIGYGAGTRNPKDFPNVLRLLSARRASHNSARHPNHDDSQTVTVLETALDDLSPQVLAYVTETALERGALDVMLTPVIMKKGRPGTLLTILCNPADSAALEQLLLRETSTLGVRIRQDRRICLDRAHAAVQTPYGEIRIKLGTHTGATGTPEVLNAHPEFEDCRAAARAHAVPVKQVQQAAIAAWLHQNQPTKSYESQWISPLCSNSSSQVQRGTVTPESATERFSTLPFAETGYEDIGHARIDHHRALRTGLPEVIYAAGKTPEQTAEIFGRMAAAGHAVLATRATPEAAAAVLADDPDRRPQPRRPHRLAGRHAHRDGWTRTIRKRPASPSSAPAPATFPSPRRPPSPPSSSAPASFVSSTSASPGCTACSACATSSPAPTRSSSAPAWRARCPRWSAAWSACPSSPFPPRSATAPASPDRPRCSAC